jgi:pseudaminic acid synthase
MKNLTINNRPIGRNHPPFIIAEMSGNHNKSLNRALKIVEAAANAGVHGLKLQTYTPETITLNVKSDDFFISDKNSLWQGHYLYDLYAEAYTPWEWHRPIFDQARELGLIVFSTPFDDTAVDFLEDLDVPCYKIASFENADLPLIRKVASTGKPMIISTGMATIAELDETIRTARQSGCNDIILLKCTSTYPASPENTNIATIRHMCDLFNCEVGLSDHTMGIGVAVAGIALGATVIEKHFTLKRSDGGIDSAFSMEPDEMKTLVQETQRAWQAIGNIHYGATEKEEESMDFRRSLYISKDMKAGERLTKDNLRIVRPGHGLKPKYFDRVFGMRVTKDVYAGDPLDWKTLK